MHMQVMEEPFFINNKGELFSVLRRLRYFIQVTIFVF